MTSDEFTELIKQARQSVSQAISEMAEDELVDAVLRRNRIRAKLLKRLGILQDARMGKKQPIDSTPKGSAPLHQCKIIDSRPMTDAKYRVRVGEDGERFLTYEVRADNLPNALRTELEKQRILSVSEASKKRKRRK